MKKNEKSTDDTEWSGKKRRLHCHGNWVEVFQSFFFLSFVAALLLELPQCQEQQTDILFIYRYLKPFMRSLNYKRSCDCLRYTSSRNKISNKINNTNTHRESVRHKSINCKWSVINWNKKRKFIPIKWTLLHLQEANKQTVWCISFLGFFHSSWCTMRYCLFLFVLFFVYFIVTTKRCNHPISTKATDQYACSFSQWTSIHNTRKLCSSTGGSYGLIVCLD